MLLWLEVSIISIKEDDRCMLIYNLVQIILLIFPEETALFISRLKSPKIIILGISVSIARSIEFSMLFKTVLSEFEGG